MSARQHKQPMWLRHMLRGELVQRLVIQSSIGGCGACSGWHARGFGEGCQWAASKPITNKRGDDASPHTIESW